MGLDDETCAGIHTIIKRFNRHDGTNSPGEDMDTIWRLFCVRCFGHALLGGAPRTSGKDYISWLTLECPPTDQSPEELKELAGASLLGLGLYNPDSDKQRRMDGYTFCDKHYILTKFFPLKDIFNMKLVCVCVCVHPPQTLKHTILQTVSCLQVIARSVDLGTKFNVTWKLKVIKQAFLMQNPSP